jgi:hypothetical protein
MIAHWVQSRKEGLAENSVWISESYDTMTPSLEI